MSTDTVSPLRQRMILPASENLHISGHSHGQLAAELAARCRAHVQTSLEFDGVQSLANQR
jgi:hypothetical protein